MKTNILLPLLAAACLAAPAVDATAKAPAKSAAKAAAKAPANRVVIQVSDDDAKKWNLALNNARNVQAELGKENSEVEIVAYGPGIGMLKADSLVANRIEEALGEGVRIVACGNTMKAQKLAKDDMVAKIDYAPAGVVELMQRQQQGWAYIRP